MGFETSGIIFMTLAFLFIGGLMAFCIYKLLISKPKK